MKQREIKFRAWNGQYMIDSNYGDWISFDGVPYTEASPHDTPNIEIEKAKDYILMEFTGLLDKNGNGTCIYEGDIISLNGLIIGNKYEDPDLLKNKTNFLIEGFGDSNWIDTIKEALVRGCKYAE